jgi:hypothetical protein
MKCFRDGVTCCDALEDGVDGRDADVGEDAVDAGEGRVARRQRPVDG